jgi:hypothetical protein
MDSKFLEQLRELIEGFVARTTKRALNSRWVNKNRESLEVWSRRVQDARSYQNRESPEIWFQRKQEYGAPRMKLKFSSWDDGDPLGWLSRVEWFFKYHHTPDDLKMEIASINLEGDAI